MGSNLFKLKVVKLLQKLKLKVSDKQVTKTS